MWDTRHYLFVDAIPVISGNDRGGGGGNVKFFFRNRMVKITLKFNRKMRLNNLFGTIDFHKKINFNIRKIITVSMIYV